MRRRNFLKAVLGVALTPIVAPLAMAKPVEKGLRGMTSCIYQIDELGYLPKEYLKTLGNKIQRNSTFGRMVAPQVAEDGMAINRDTLKRFQFKTYEAGAMPDFGNKRFPLNVYTKAIALQ